MIPLSINNQTCFFSVKHITKELSAKLIYGIHLNTFDYFLSKSLGLNDCEQLDSNPQLDADLLDVICTVITEVENKYKKRPTLELINNEIFRILGRIRNPRLNTA
ncbi:MAG: hypothetical protein JWR12_2787 [Mucilaginibacter sp.]|jgi:hypothetical protein|nr:hypothetical protein [Mucilaginibacter sp.]